MTAVDLTGYHLSFDAEFTTAADMSQFSNAFENGDTTLYNNHEAENYVPYDPTNPDNPYSFANGALTITASPNASNGLPYTSGLLDTAGIFSQSSGYFEIRAAMPSSPGFWPAFWMLPYDYYPEIDILEQPNNSGSQDEYWTHTSTPTDSSGGFSDVGTDVFSGYHTYGFLWTADSIQYTFDGQLVGWAHEEPPALDGLKMYLLANLAVGAAGCWTGTPIDGATSSYSIDYIRAFSNDPAVPTVAQEAISSPDGADTNPFPTVVLPTVPVPKTIGAGPTKLVLQLSEDAWQGDAQFTISVDGVQQGGIQTVSASHADGQEENFTLKGQWQTGTHIVTIDFLNAASDGTGDSRNLYVAGATVGGTTIGNSSLNAYDDGNRSFGFKATSPAEITIGSGPDTFLIAVSELTASSANAVISIAIDGTRQGSTKTVKALANFGQQQLIAVKGNFGDTAHQVKVSLLNSNGDGPSLIVDSVSYDRLVAGAANVELTANGSAVIPTAAATPTDTLVITMGEDAWQGDAEASIAIDGQALSTPTITFLQSSGQAQSFTYFGDFGGASATHDVTVDFLNDLYLAPGEDRNLYVDTITFDGTTYVEDQDQRVDGAVQYSLAPPAPSGAATITYAAGHAATGAVAPNLLNHV